MDSIYQYWYDELGWGSFTPPPAKNNRRRNKTPSRENKTFKDLIDAINDMASDFRGLPYLFD